MKAQKRLCEDAIYNHLADAVESDRKTLSEQWERNSINPRVKARHDNNVRKLREYEDNFN